MKIWQIGLKYLICPIFYAFLQNFKFKNNIVGYIVILNFKYLETRIMAENRDFLKFFNRGVTIKVLWNGQNQYTKLAS